jgi:RHS repeat-associated protein
MHARHYSPLTGRFLCTDKHDVLSLQFGDADARAKFHEYLTTPHSWNRYTYAKSSPIKHVDPDGYAAELVIGAPFVAGGTAAGGGAAATAAAPLILATSAGVAIGYGVNQIPGVSAALTIQPLSDALANIFFSGGQGAAARDFINAKVVTVLQHIGKYSPPDPNDRRDQSDKKGLGDRLRKHLEAARNRLKRLKGNTREQYEELIRRTEDALEEWIAGGPPPV